MQCQAKAKSTGQQCRRRAVSGKQVCTVHGGLTPGGIASPHWKHGRYSKYAPTRLIERYIEAQSDSEILNLTEEIALVDARIADVLKRVDAGESGQIWSELQEKRKKFLGAQRKQDQETMAEALTDILNLVARGHADWSAWLEVMNLIERRRRLVESEQRRRMSMHLLIKVEEAAQAMVILADAVRGAVVEYVRDPEERQRVLVAVQQALSRYLAPSSEVAAGGQSSATDMA